MRELPTRYESNQLEQETYKKWEKSGLTNPHIAVKKKVVKKTAKPFSIVLPPPNVTGTLHMGHAAMLAIEDIMVRHHRMKGYKTWWIPGTDHAAIATQSKVEQILYKQEGKTKHDLGRAEFLRRVEAFAQESHDTIANQVRRMGASVDWSSEAYTLDEKRNLAVRTAFKEMYEAGLIYRGHRMVNWDPKLQTTVSDDEIEWKEEKTNFYYLKYGPFVIGTARPETKFGDKYVVMHPKDARYLKYKHGEKIDLEWINGPVTATVIKDTSIDMEFGTGVMTITPWHDATDFDIAERHNLEKEQIIDERGILLGIAGEFAGMHIKKARALIIEKLQSKGLVEKIDEAYDHRIAVNSRGGGAIEPQIKEQWFVAVNKEFTFPHKTLKGVPKGTKTTLKKLMQHAVKSKQIEILPSRFDKTYFHWINNLRDWCISRQLWYGHRIPVWYCLSCKASTVNPKVKSKWFLVRHGETDWNKETRLQGHSNIPLNDTGRAQAKLAGEQLKNQDIAMIISSDLERCRETAEIIAKETGAPIIFDKNLRERSYGIAEGMANASAEEKFGAGWRAKKEPGVEGAESWEDLEKRILSAFHSHKTKNGHKNVVVVSHGGVMRTLMGKIRNLTHEERVSRKSIQNAEILSLDILSKKCKCGSDLYEQDPDTLDTWFSSGLWTFSTLGWPAKAKDLKEFHPTSVLETGYDIIFFWVARMILMSTYLVGQVPFKKVYLHGLVRDAQGRKMSKSLDNIINPLDLIEKYGADATRLSLVIGAGPGNDLRLSEDKVKGYRNFTTKIWNAARFVMMNRPEGKLGKIALTPKDKRHLKELATTKKNVSAFLEKYDFNLAGETLYHYFWHTFADKIIEEYKPHLKIENIESLSAKDKKQAIQNQWRSYYVLEQILTESLKMLHPFMPFVTEEIWNHLKPGQLLMVEKW